MWMIDPMLLCRQHLLGEHAEIHKFRHNFVKQHSIDGRLSPVVQIEPIEMERRHNDLAAEMVRRGYKHQSPYSLPDLSYLSHDQVFAKVDREESRRELCKRCNSCRMRIMAYTLGYHPEQRVGEIEAVEWPALDELAKKGEGVMRGYVYIGQDNSNKGYKIGKTVHVRKREREIQSTNPSFRMLACAFVEDYSEVEISLHVAFCKNQTHREWFDLSKDELDKLLNIGIDWRVIS
jgi:hypothetical protein